MRNVVRSFKFNIFSELLSLVSTSLHPSFPLVLVISIGTYPFISKYWRRYAYTDVASLGSIFARRSLTVPVIVPICCFVIVLEKALDRRLYYNEAKRETLRRWNLVLQSLTKLKNYWIILTNWHFFMNHLRKYV